MFGECPVCGAEITLSEDTVVGELIECIDCGTELEVVDVDPVVLAEANLDEEDLGE